MNIVAAGPSESLTLTNTGEDRPAGVHLSDILKRRAFERDKRFNPENPIDAMTLECGFTWEEVLSGALKRRHGRRAGYRPEPILHDGVWVSPDWINPDGLYQHEEWKATRKSTKNYEAKIDEWKDQCKSYVYVLLKHKLITRPASRLRVWFMCGDWSFESKGDYTLLRDYWDIDIEWDIREVTETWVSVLNDGVRFGLLKPKDLQWQKTESKRIVGNRSSEARLKSSSGKVLAGTFPTTKSRNRSSSGS